MEKGHINMNKYSVRKENGVALLFALGLLALLSVVGTAFVANALTAKKISANTSSRNQAQILLDSTVARVMVGIMAIMKQENSYSDFTKVYSSTDDIPPYGGQDQIVSASGEPSLLDVQLPGYAKYDGNKSSATWIPIRKDPADNTSEIIGRIAYQVLPTGTSSMSLNSVLQGIYTQGELKAVAFPI